ncbi:hypothetical protein ABLE92_23340 [Gordonia sp. VNQ95]|uniref:hypothetical protein n=1 Tax=Gordonia TaxID=2053 RepID=UPI0032B50E42
MRYRNRVAIACGAMALAATSLTMTASPSQAASRFQDGECELRGDGPLLPCEYSTSSSTQSSYPDDAIGTVKVHIEAKTNTGSSITCTLSARGVPELGTDEDWAGRTWMDLELPQRAAETRYDITCESFLSSDGELSGSFVIDSSN